MNTKMPDTHFAIARWCCPLVAERDLQTPFFLHTHFAGRAWRRAHNISDQAARGCVLELDADTAARGISGGLCGLVADAIAPQAATGRPEGAG